MMYRLVIKLKGVAYYFECDTIGEAYRVAKLVAAKETDKEKVDNMDYTRLLL